MATENKLNFLFLRANFPSKRLLVVLFLFIVGGHAARPVNRKTLRQGAVASNGKECAEMGAAILKQRGSVADAAVTTLLCEGITCENCS